MVVTVDNAPVSGEPHPLPRGPLLPGEAPEAAAVRVLAKTVGVTDVFHAPVPLGHRSETARDGQPPTLTIGYAVLGPRPSNSRETARAVTVDRDRSTLGARVDQPVTVLLAREAVKDLLETTSLALRLLDPKLTQFTLAHLRALFAEVLGPGFPIDVANFRRKVEAAKDFVRPCEAPTPVRKRGRPANWYVAGEAEVLDPPIRLRRG
jgi:ADP-ribose pyrophosphatase YjhB (NUDIX family)